MNERVLVTGASGFIGHHLVTALLERGDRVCCLVRPTSNTAGLPTGQVSLTTGDITDPASLPAALAGVGTVYHLAGALTARSRAEFHTVNQAGVRYLAEACARAKPTPTLVILSSLAAAGPNPANHPRREPDPEAPVSHYGRSKLAGERAARAFAKQVPLTIIRAPIVFGEWDRDVFKMFRLVRRGIHLIPVGPHQRYSIVHAADLAGLLIQTAVRGERAVDGSTTSGLYYTGYQDPVTYPELGALLAEALGGRGILNLRVPRPIIWAAAAAFEAVARLTGRPPNIVNFDKTREGFAGSWSCSPAKAQEQLGFHPAQPLATRLKQTADWYRAAGWL